jgi:hypothetical protein
MVPAIRTAAADGNRTADIAGQRIIAKMRKLGVKLGLVQERVILGNSGRGVMAPTSSWWFDLVVGAVAGRPINFGGISRSREVPANVGRSYR